MQNTFKVALVQYKAQANDIKCNLKKGNKNNISSSFYI